MPYTDAAKLTARFGEQELIALTDRAVPPAGAIDNAILDGAIADAGAEIDSYVGARYAVPLAVVPSMVEVVACDITRYRLFAARATEEVTRRYTAAVAYLKRVAEGTALLLDDSGAEIDKASESVANAAPVATTKTIAFGSDFETLYIQKPGT